jgi:hypothetical protein
MATLTRDTEYPCAFDLRLLEVNDVGVALPDPCGLPQREGTSPSPTDIVRTFQLLSSLSRGWWLLRSGMSPFIGLPDVLAGEVGVDLSGGYVGMSQHFLN